MATKARKKNISDKQFKRELIDSIGLGMDYVHRKSNFYEYIRTKYSVERQRSLRLWDEFYPEIMDEFIDNSMNAAKDKLAEYLDANIEIRQERVVHLEKELSIIIKELRGEVEYTYLHKGKLCKSHQDGAFVVPVQIRNNLRQEMTRLQSEISKIQGDYAPTKIQGVGAIAFTPVPDTPQ